MKKKKISFSITPDRGTLVNAIDNWVAGENKENTQKPPPYENKNSPELAKTTFMIPKGLYKKLKKISLIEDKTITQKLTEILETNLPDV